MRVKCHWLAILLVHSTRVIKLVGSGTVHYLLLFLKIDGLQDQFLLADSKHKKKCMVLLMMRVENNVCCYGPLFQIILMNEEVL